MAREYIKFKRYKDKFDRFYIQNRLDKGDTIRIISRDIDIPEKRLAEMVKYFGLNVTNKGVTYYVNHNYFDSIDTERKAYFLGFIVSDGCITEDKKKNGHISKRLCFCNSIDDREVLEEMVTDLCPNYTIKWKNKSTDTVTRKDQCELRLTSNHMCDTLINKYGIKPNKTMDVDFELKNVSDDLFIHFIRGFMDGDGSVTNNAISLTCTFPKLLKQIEMFMCSKGFTSRLRESEGKTINYYKLFIKFNGNKDYMKELLYRDATIFLNRKHKKLTSC